MGAFVRDLHHGLRGLARQPLYTLTAAITLSLGIGANAAIFSVAYGFLLRPLPYPDADRLAMVWSANPARGWRNMDISISDAVDWKERTGVFTDLAVANRASFNITGVEQPERVNGLKVSPNLLRVLGTPPIVGRDFEEGDAGPAGARVAIVSWGLWQRRMGGDPATLGSTLHLNGDAYTVVGVLAQDFTFSDNEVDIFVPLDVVPADVSRASHSSLAVARLKPGVGVEQATREVSAVSASLAEEYPETNEGMTASVVGLRADLVGDIGRQAILVLMTAVFFVLLMSCVNVANLMLARSNGRQREMAVRAALGAGRLRMFRQLLTESFALSFLGAVFGLGIGYGGIHVIAASMPSNLPPAFHFGMDPAVLVFVLVLSIVATLAFGTLPAMRASAASSQALREEGRTGEGRRSRRFGGSLIIVQTSLAVVLLVGGGMMMRNVTQIQNQDFGYDPTGVLTARITPPESRYPDDIALNHFYGEVLGRLRALPGVESAGTIQSLPLRGSNNVGTFEVVGDPGPATDGYPVRVDWISTGFLDAMHVAVRRGRDFADADRADGQRVVLVNETLVRQRFGDGDPIGRTVRFSGETWTIVGVVTDMLERSVTRAPEPSIYVHSEQEAPRSRNIAVRSKTEAVALAASLERIVLSIDPDQPIYEVEPMTALVDRRVSPFRLIAGLMLAFALVSLVLGAVGIFGVTAYSVGRRTHEIGIRMAVGAARQGVVRMIVREGMSRAAIGIIAGVALALPLTRALRTMLVGVEPGDPVTFVSVVIVLAVVTFLGAWIPARRAARLDPLRAIARE
jgi:putative ABC transport system permease protein